MTNLMQASTQWATRPADERFDSLDALHDAAHADAMSTRAFNIPVNKFVIEPMGRDGLVFKGSQNYATFSNLAMRQFATKLEIPQGMLNPHKFDNSLIAQVMNHRIAKMDPENILQIYLSKKNENYRIRCLTTDSYVRVSDHSIVNMIREQAKSNNWKVPPARPVNDRVPGARKATEADVLALREGGGGIAINVGDTIAPAGLYRGEEDMFIFLVNEDHSVDDGFGNKLGRGKFVTNSETGTRRFVMMEFNYQTVCGNHIVWGASNIVEIGYNHVGSVHGRIADAIGRFEIKDNDNLDRLRTLMAKMRTQTIGADKEEVVENIYSMRLGPALTKRFIEGAFENAADYVEVDHNPLSWLGITNAMTRFSQQSEHAQDRFELDRTIGKMFDRAQKVFA